MASIGDGGVSLDGQTQLVDKLRELAPNLWWTWQPNVIALFRELDPALWRRVDHNPVEFLERLPAEQLERREPPRWHSIRESTTRFAGWRSISRIPAFVGSGACLDPAGAAGRLFFRRVRPARKPADLFRRPRSPRRRSSQERQRPGHPLDRRRAAVRRRATSANPSTPTAGSRNPILNADLDLLPIESGSGPRRQASLGRRSHTTTGYALRAGLEGGGRADDAYCCLDSNVPENTESDRSLTARLYGGDARVRIRQELLLGVGGVRALHALRIHPAVLHLNEGHSAFATLEMIRSAMEQSDLPFGEVVRDVAGMTVFTTHTPVAAGHDRFHRLAGRGAPRQDPRGTATSPMTISWAWAESTPATRTSRFVMHGAGTQARSLCQWRQCPARSSLAADVAPFVPQLARGERADRPYHQRSSRPKLGCAANALVVRPKPGNRLAEAPAPSRNLGRDRDGRRRRAVGDAAGTESPVDQLRPQPPGVAGAAPR